MQIVEMRVANQCLHVGVVQPIVLDYFKTKVPFIIENIKVTLWFMCKFMHEQFGLEFLTPSNTWQTP